MHTELFEIFHLRTEKRKIPDLLGSCGKKKKKNPLSVKSDTPLVSPPRQGTDGTWLGTAVGAGVPTDCRWAGDAGSTKQPVPRKDGERDFIYALESARYCRVSIRSIHSVQKAKFKKSPLFPGVAIFKAIY